MVTAPLTAGPSWLKFAAFDAQLVGRFIFALRFYGAVSKRYDAVPRHAVQKSAHITPLDGSTRWYYDFASDTGDKLLLVLTPVLPFYHGERYLGGDIAMKLDDRRYFRVLTEDGTVHSILAQKAYCRVVI